MRTLKIAVVIIAVILASSRLSYSQGFLDKLKDKVEEKVTEGVEKSIDEENKDKKVENKQEPAKQENQTKPDGDKAPQTESLKSYSKYDFIPGEKVIFFEDFSQDALADFPARWNTNASGEVVTLNKYPGKWFKMKPGGTFYPEWDVKGLPENYTIEYDYIYNFRGEMNPPEFYFCIYKANPGEAMDGIVAGQGGIQFRLGAHGFGLGAWRDGGWEPNDGSIDNEMLLNKYDNIIRVSIWVQKQRVRLYVNQEKIFDMPRIAHKDLSYDRFRFNLWGTDPTDFDPMITNFRVAVGAPDTRSKLLTEGKLVTRGIKFDTGSDKIKPESYGVLKDIATVLKENASVKVKIIGHTDTDGSADKNLDLSKRRAASVKNSLSGEFGIDAGRMETDGKGQTEPCDVNTTTEGKANNRRVEFIKTN